MGLLTPGKIHQIDRSGHICTRGRPDYRTQCVYRGQALLPHIWRYARQPVAAGNRLHFVQATLMPNTIGNPLQALPTVLAPASSNAISVATATRLYSREGTELASMVQQQYGATLAAEMS